MLSEPSLFAIVAVTSRGTWTHLLIPQIISLGPYKTEIKLSCTNVSCRYLIRSQCKNRAKIETRLLRKYGNSNRIWIWVFREPTIAPALRHLGPFSVRFSYSLRGAAPILGSSIYSCLYLPPGWGELSRRRQHDITCKRKTTYETYSRLSGAH